MDADIESVTILPAGWRGSVTVEQAQPAAAVQEWATGPVWRSGRELLDASGGGARAWLVADGGGR